MSEIQDLPWWEAKAIELRTKADDMLAAGVTKGLSAVIDAADRAGLAYNRRKRRLDWEASHLPEPEPEPEHNPIREQLDRLDDRRKLLAARLFQAELARRVDAAAEEPGGYASNGGQSDEAEFVLDMAAFVDGLLAMSDEAVMAEVERLSQESRSGSRSVEPEPLQEPVEPPTSPVTPIRQAPAPRMVIDVGGTTDHDRGWQPLDRREAP